MPGRLPPDEEAAETADAPEFLELGSGDISKADVTVLCRH